MRGLAVGTAGGDGPASVGSDQPIARRSLFRRMLRAGGDPVEILPPWTDQDLLTDRCDGCGDCVSACADSLISLNQNGLPHLSFAEHGCTLCGDCAAACPTQAITAPQDWAGHPFDHAFDVTPKCLSLLGVACRLCEDSCETAAIRFRLLPEGKSIPLIDAQACTGCGECFAVCPENALSMVARPSQQPDQPRTETMESAR